MTTIPHHRSEALYVITHDLGTRIKSLRSLGLETPEENDLFFQEFHRELKSRISSMLPNTQVVSYDMGEMSERILREAVRFQNDLKDCIVLSTCPEIAMARRGHLIEINRIVDKEGSILGLGPRPGNPSLKNQFASISRFAKGKQVVLVEDGAFSGQTLGFLVDQLLSHDINVVAIVVGICFPGALEKIREVFHGKFLTIEESAKPYEWMPDHDFIPFAPNCGRVFGGTFGEETLPYYSHDGMSYSFPYIRPFGNMEKWASIPAEHTYELSLFCIHQALALFNKLGELNGRELTISDLKGSTPRISLPITAGSSALIEPNTTIVDFLQEVCREMA